MSGKLYVVATPIGNLEDLSPRAARVLREADIVAAEDTRSVQVLLERADVGGEVKAGRRVTSVFEGNEAARAESIVAELVAGKDVALVSEAGTPGVSDPGERVVRAVIEAGLSVVPVPGPVAAIAALVASGLPATEFRFVGFPPREAGARAELFGRVRGDVATLICYEAPDRVGATLATMVDAFGGARRACVSREVTKRYEEHVRGTLAELAATFAETGPRGECTIVVAGAGEGEAAPVVDLEAEVRALLATGMGPKDVAQRLVAKTGKPRRELYQLALALARATGESDA
ncbi:MAG TPA: 16S rRNA (cytidine(1402)-2'-O)-methyltransferase [Kofleriaceae bacterium]|nr:16S rRNA (cytidine(1402)-2'-O)-methyltransferase [Kofleriaceae bacterium]